MAYRIIDAGGQVLDAHLDLEGADIKFYSRGGAKGDEAARNLDYGIGLRTVLQQLADAGVAVLEAMVDSGPVQHLPRDQRLILSAADPATPEQQFTLMSRRMKEVGRSSLKPGGNSTKLIRIRTSASSAQLRHALRLQPVAINLASANRIPDTAFRVVRAEHVWMAAEALRSATSWAPYSPSKDYDVLLEDGVRLPPKALFGRAATLALGYEVLPRHFAGGLGTVAFGIINAAGYPIVPKEGRLPAAPLPPSEEEGWAEGGLRLGRHMRRERAYGLAQAKKSHFRSEHSGRLFCEVCEWCPEEGTGDPLAAACIEVHHRATAVADMPEEGHKTKLEDLQCVCANCHRLIHARIRAAEAAATMEEPV